MNEERWLDLTERIRDKFKVTLDVERELDPGPGRIEEIEFEAPQGKLRLERVSRPIVLERKTHFSRRIGGETSEEFVYAENEFSNRVTFYRWIDGVWQEEDYRNMMGGASR